MKKKLWILLASLLVLMMVPFTSFAEEWEEIIRAEADEIRSGEFNCNLHYTIGRDSSLYSFLRVSGTGEMANYVDPGYFCEADRHPRYWSMTTEDGYSFRQISKLILEPGITRIGDLAFVGHPGGFSNSSMTCSTVFLTFPVRIPDTVTWIGDYAFAQNNYMGDVYIPDSVTHIGQNAFFYNVRIHCTYGSYAYEYAKANNYPVSLIGPDKLEAPNLSLSSVASTGKIKLTWDKQDGADAYKVYRATSKTGTYKLQKTTTAGAYTDTSAVAGSLYYYKVKAVSNVNSRADSSFSKIISRRADLPKVTGLKATNLTASGRVRLRWEAVDKAAGYRVYRAASKTGTYSLLKTIKSPDTLLYDDSSAEVGKTYYYKVRAYHSNSAADGAQSDPVSRVRKPKQAPAPTLTNTSTGIKVTINAVDGAYGYRIYRKAAGESSFTRVTSTTKMSWTDKNVVSGKSYTYKVAAYVKAPSGEIVAGISGATATKTYRK